MIIGFVVYNEDPVRLIRRYDPFTEEVSNQPVDALTSQNLLEQVEQGQVPPTRLLKYDQVVAMMPSQQSSGGQQQQEENTWKHQTQYINQSNIMELRGLTSGNKIVPGSYDPELEEEETISASSSPSNNKPHTISDDDGKSIDYPPIPVIDTKLSLATHKHAGTKRFLAQLTPNARTQLFVQTDAELQQTILNQVVLKEYYGNSYQALLGDLELSFCLFLYLQCLSSLEHWKDLVAMLSFSCCYCSSSSGKDNNRAQYPALYLGLLQILPYQLSRMDAGFLEDVDEAGGNFLLPSLGRLQRNLCWGDYAIADSEIIRKFQHVLVNKFPQTFSESSLRIQMLPNGAAENDGSMEVDGMAGDDDDDDEDGPVMVSSEDIEASLARSTNEEKSARHGVPLEIQKAYPLLVAAIQPHEDIVMTCARALDAKTDVSLVREAAAYLEDVEQYPRR
ncbi:MAG: hypothetical protein SGILL_003039 [Bacillariaceae sp.]